MKFEDLAAWQKARSLTKEIYRVTQKGEFCRDFGLASQVQRAAASILSNIAEGHERDGSAEYHRFLCMAKASSAEVRSELYVAHDVGYLLDEEFKSLPAMTEEVGRILGGLLVAIKNRGGVRPVRTSRPSSLNPHPSQV